MMERKRPKEVLSEANVRSEGKKVYTSPDIVYEKKIEVLAALCGSTRSGWGSACRKTGPCTKLNQ